MCKIYLKILNVLIKNGHSCEESRPGNEWLLKVDNKILQNMARRTKMLPSTRSGNRIVAGIQIVERMPKSEFFIENIYYRQLIILTLKWKQNTL